MHPGTRVPVSAWDPGTRFRFRLNRPQPGRVPGSEIVRPGGNYYKRVNRYFYVRRTSTEFIPFTEVFFGGGRRADTNAKKKSNVRMASLIGSKLATISWKLDPQKKQSGIPSRFRAKISYRMSAWPTAGLLQCVLYMFVACNWFRLKSGQVYLIVVKITKTKLLDYCRGLVPKMWRSPLKNGDHYGWGWDWNIVRRQKVTKYVWGERWIFNKLPKLSAWERISRSQKKSSRNVKLMILDKTCGSNNDSSRVSRDYWHTVC